MLKRLLLASFLGAGLVMAGCAAPAPQAVADEAGFASPQDLLGDIYKQYADKPAGSGIDLSAPGAVEKYFAPELAQKINADMERAKATNDIPVLNGDPFVDSQDWQITNVAFAVGKSAEPDETMAVVKFKNYGEQKEVKLSLAKTAIGWQIADIDWGYESLSKILAE